MAKRSKRQADLSQAKKLDRFEKLMAFCEAHLSQITPINPWCDGLATGYAKILEYGAYLRGQGPKPPVPLGHDGKFPETESSWK